MTPIVSIEIPFGRSSVTLIPPDWVELSTVSSGRLPVPEDSAELIADAIATPIGSMPLRALARGRKNACIAVTDATRQCPDHLLVPPMLRELEASGIEPDQITIIVAIGTHRASTEAEKREKLGDAIVDRYRVVDHDPYDPTALLDCLVTVDGIPVQLNRRVIESDLVLATGRVEPHQYAGYSGGGKTVAIGCAAEPVIAYTHGPAMLDRPGTRLGVLEGNPFQATVRDVARAAKVAFVANCVLDDDGNLVAVGYGEPEAVQNALAEQAAALYVAQIERQFDIAVAGVGYPKDQNVYQASRAASYLHFAPTSVVRPGGVIIVPAACPEGPGQGVGEQRFFAAMCEERASFLARVGDGDLRPGEQRAYIMAQVLESVSVLFAGVLEPGPVEAMGFLTAPTMEDAMELAGDIAGRPSRTLVVPHALLTMPVVAPVVTA